MHVHTCTCTHALIKKTRTLEFLAPAEITPSSRFQPYHQSGELASLYRAWDQLVLSVVKVDSLLKANVR